MHSKFKAIGLIATFVALAAVIGSTSSLLDGLSAQADDLLQPGVDDSGDVVVVGIDRATLADVGLPWPWPRDVHAELVDAIAEAQPETVVYDVVFADAGPDDAALATAMEKVPTILASALTLRLVENEPPIVVDEVGPNPVLARAATGIGHANVAVSQQRGIVRRLAFYALDDRGFVVPSLTAATMAELEGSTAFVERPGGLQVGDRLIPLESGELRINYASALVDSGAIVSAGSILDGTADLDVLEGKIVVVGVTEPTLGDLHLVPNDKSGSVPGVLVQANALNTVLSRSWIVPVAPSRQWLLLAGAAFATVASFALLRLRSASAVTLAVIVACVAWSSWRFSSAGVVWDLLWPVVTVALGASATVVWRYLSEYRYRRLAQSLFAEYVPGDVMDLLTDRRALDKATEGRRIEVSLLFCDLRGFTPIAGALTPADVRQLLEHYYEYATTIIHEHGGTVMQFVGDEVFAIFGAPVASATSSADCVSAAVQLVHRVDALHETLENDGLPALVFGIGIHRGEVVAAHVGTSAHRQYSVIGDPVNVGSRLCSQASAGEVVASERALCDADGDGFVAIGDVALRGVGDVVPASSYRDATRRTPPVDERSVNAFGAS